MPPNAPQPTPLILMNTVEYIEKIMGYMATSPHMWFLFIYVGINNQNHEIQGIFIVLLIFNFYVFFFFPLASELHQGLESAVWQSILSGPTSGFIFTDSISVARSRSITRGASTSALTNTGPCEQPRTEKAEWRPLRDLVLASWNPVSVLTAKRVEKSCSDAVLFLFWNSVERAARLLPASSSQDSGYWKFVWLWV